MKRQSTVLFLGPEEGEKHAAIAAIRDAVKKAGNTIEEYSYFAFETPVEEVVSLLQNGSLFGSYALLRYRNVEAVKKKDDLRRLTAYIKQPNDDATLILESGQIHVGKAIEDAVGSANKRIFWEMFDNQKEGWVRGYVQRKGASIDTDAIELLLDLVDNNTAVLRVELDRLVSFVGNSVSLGDVDRYIFHAKEESVFTLFDAVAAGDFAHAMSVFEKLSAVEEMGRILAGLSWQFERLALLHRLAESSGSRSGAFSAKGVAIRSKRAQKTYLDAMDRYDYATVKRGIVLINGVEEVLRSVPAPVHHGAVQNALYSLMVRGARWNYSAPVSVPSTYALRYS